MHIPSETHYINQGDGPPVILIHGIAASLHDWTDITPRLAAAGFQPYAVDLLGHGESPKPDDLALYHIEAIYSHFKNWLKGLQLSQPPLLVGHSMGGYISLMYALQNPQEVGGLVLINPLYSPQQLSRVVQWAGRRPDMSEKAWQAVPEWLVQTISGWHLLTASNLPARARRQNAIDFKRASPKLAHITRDIPDLTPRLSEVNIPTMVIWGDRDLTLKPSWYPRLAHALPCATSHPVAGSGHQLHIEHHTLVSRLTQNFYTSLNRMAGRSTYGIYGQIDPA